MFSTLQWARCLEVLIIRVEEVVAPGESTGSTIRAISRDVSQLSSGFAGSASSGRGSSRLEEFVESFGGDSWGLLDLLRAEDATGSALWSGRRRGKVFLIESDFMLLVDGVLRRLGWQVCHV